MLCIGRGGLETMSVNLSVELARRGLRVVTIALDEGGQLEPTLAAAGIEYHILGGRDLLDPRFHWRLGRLLRRVGADVVHSHNFASLLHSAVACRLGAVRRFVHTEHAYEYIAEQPHYLKWLKLAGRQCNTFVVVGDRLAPFYAVSAGLGSRVRVIPNGVALPPLASARELRARRVALGVPDGLLIGTAGRFAPEKNYGLLLRAFARLRQQHRGAHLLMLGEGVERGALESLGVELGLGDAVRFLGWRDDATSVLGALDVFALTSLNEGLPLALLEAMAHGVAVVSTPVGDVPGVVRDGTTGFLFPSGDESALTALLVRLAADAGTRAAAGRAAREAVAARYSHDAMVERYLDAYGIASVARTAVTASPATSLSA